MKDDYIENYGDWIRFDVKIDTPTRILIDKWIRSNSVDVATVTIQGYGEGLTNYPVYSLSHALWLWMVWL